MLYFNHGQQPPYYYQPQQPEYYQQPQQSYYGNTYYNNMMPIGGVGYYNNPYNNPYVYMEQERLRKLKEEEEAKQYTNLLKTLSRNVQKISGEYTDEEIEENLKAYDPVEPPPKMSYTEYIEQEQHRMNMVNIYDIHYNSSKEEKPMFHPDVIPLFNLMEERKKIYPPDMNAAQFFEMAGTIMFRDELEEREKELKNLTKLYDRNKFQQLIDLNNNGMGYMDTIYNNNPGFINPGFCTDADEIHIPTSADNEYNQRRAAFLNSILSKN